MLFHQSTWSFLQGNSVLYMTHGDLVQSRYIGCLLQGNGIVHKMHGGDVAYTKCMQDCVAFTKTKGHCLSFMPPFFGFSLNWIRLELGID